LHGLVAAIRSLRIRGTGARTLAQTKNPAVSNPIGSPIGALERGVFLPLEASAFLECRW
jgi:hypothetical protein